MKLFSLWCFFYLFREGTRDFVLGVFIIPPTTEGVLLIIVLKGRHKCLQWNISLFVCIIIMLSQLVFWRVLSVLSNSISRQNSEMHIKNISKWYSPYCRKGCVHGGIEKRFPTNRRSSPKMEWRRAFLLCFYYSLVLMNWFHARWSFHFLASHKQIQTKARENMPNESTTPLPVEQNKNTHTTRSER